MQCSKCGEYLLKKGGISVQTKNPVKILRKFEISEYHYITDEGDRLCEECFNLWWFGKSFKKNRQICELRREIWKLEKEMRKDAS